MTVYYFLATSSKRCFLRATMTTREKPDEANLMAVAAPMPELAPATKATKPSFLAEDMFFSDRRRTQFGKWTGVHHFYTQR